MNTIQLECFAAVAEHLNFSKASRVLKITQPAVSHQIQTLEEELEVKLFSRTSKSVSLTQEGLLFLADAQLILKTALSAKERLKTHEGFLPFDLGCHNHMILNLFPPVFEAMTKDFPLLRPNIHLVPFPSLLGMVENGQIHAAFVAKEEQRRTSLQFIELCRAPIACVCSPKHPLARQESLSCSQLSGSLISCSPRQISDSIFAVQSAVLAGLPAEERYFTENIESALTLAKARMGYTLYPDVLPAREPGLCYIPVKDFPSISFGVYCRYNHDNPALQRFVALLKESLKKTD